jgi:hypothetical protein
MSIDEKDSVLRVNRDRNWKQINLTATMDDRLTWKAKALHTYLVTRPDEWSFNERDIIKRGKDGRDGVRAGLIELEEAGYLRRETIFGAGHRAAGRRWTINEVPDTEDGFSGGGISGGGNPDPIKEGVEGKKEENQHPQAPAGAGESVAGMGVPLTPPDRTKPKPSEPQSEDEGFDEAWALYPRSNTPNRMAALKAWRARIREGIPPADLMAGVRSYAASVARKGTKPKYVKMAATFFGPNRWWEIDYADDVVAGVESMLRRESVADDPQPQQSAPVAEHQPYRHPLQYTAVDERTPLEKLRWHLFRYRKEEALDLKVELGLLGQPVEDSVMGRTYQPYPEEFDMLAGCS